MARRQARVGRPRQRVEWTGGHSADFTILGANSVTALGSSIITLLAIDSMTSPTLVRVRGEIVVAATGGTANGDVALGAGIAVVNRRASTVGSSALPRPISDMDYSWLWHSIYFLKTTATATQIVPTVGIVRDKIDSRAMRKILSKEEEIAYMFETQNDAGNATVEFAIQTRLLLKES